MLKSLLLLSAVIGIAAAPANPGRATQEPASVPETQAPATPSAPSSTVKNPVKPTADSQAKAKKMYGFDCEMCHAANGSGKTDLAKDMSLTLKDWTEQFDNVIDSGQRSTTVPRGFLVSRPGRAARRNSVDLIG